MGNTPSAQHGSPRPGSGNPTSPNSTKHPNLRLPMPARPNHISPQSSNPTSPSGLSGRSTSPRRRKSLELPDLNKLSFTPAAPVPTTATHTSHHLAPSTPAAGHIKRTDAVSSPTRRWQQVLGAKSPLAGPNSLGAMSKLDTAPRSASAATPTPQSTTSYFPPTDSPRKSVPIPIPGKEVPVPRVSVEQTSGATPPPPTSAPTPPPPADENDGLVEVTIQWKGGGRQVFVTGNFADNWKKRIPLKRSTHDFNTVLRLPPGQYRLKFIVDDSWRCARHIPTATDDDGTLVNWLEVDAPLTEDEIKAEWAMDSKPAAKQEETDESEWTQVIPEPLTLYQYLEELPLTFPTREAHDAFYSSAPFVSGVPPPPTLPRILERVIVNAEPRRQWDDAHLPGWSNAPSGILDDNSILAVPNHVVLNHLTASAIKNGTLGVGTTTRYRKKYITTMFFKPTPQDLMGEGVSQGLGDGSAADTPVRD